MACRSVNPATGEVLKDFTEHIDEQMWNALASADKAFRSWAPIDGAGVRLQRAFGFGKTREFQETKKCLRQPRAMTP